MNESKTDHLCHWTQHVTLGPPFLAPEQSRVSISGTRGRTFPHGYEGKALLESSRNFYWPYAPGRTGASVDLRQPFTRAGLGFVAAVLLDPRRNQEYIAALNAPEHLLLGYCFARADFPWTAVWEENRARTDAPWSGRTQARGLEFGSTPFPVGRREAFANGSLFGAPHFSVIPARSRKTVDYLSFLAAVPPGFHEVGDIRCAPGEILIQGRGGKTLAGRCDCRQADSPTRTDATNTNKEGKLNQTVCDRPFRVMATLRRADLTHCREGA